MTTAAQRLVALSGLGSASAAQHFLATQGGSGAEKKVFCSQITAVVDFAELVVSRKPEQQAPAIQEALPAGAQISKAQKSAVAFRPQSISIFSFLSPQEIVVTHRPAKAVTSLKLDQKTIINRHPNL